MDYSTLKEFFVGDQHWQSLIGWHVAVFFGLVPDGSLAKFC